MTAREFYRLAWNPELRHDPEYEGCAICPLCACLLLPTYEICPYHGQEYGPNSRWHEENKAYCDFLHRKIPWTRYPDVHHDADALGPGRDNNEALRELERQFGSGDGAAAWAQYDDLIEAEEENDEPQRV